MVRRLSIRGSPCGPVFRRRRLRPSIVRAAHTQSTDAAKESGGKEADLFTELKKISEQQEEIQKREAQKERWESSGSPKVESSLETLSYQDIDESSIERSEYHSQLFTAAKDGDVTLAEELVRQMVSEGFEPGPRAYHALVFAHVKAGSATGALAAIRRAHSSGARPLTESYVVLIYAFMKEKNIKNAEAVFSSMLRPNANADPEKGQTLVVVVGTGERFDSKALECLEDGRQESFSPDRDLFAQLIHYYCKNGAYENALEELNELLSLQREAKNDMFCEIRHVKDLLAHFAEQGDVRMVLWLASLPDSYDLRCYNAILRGILNSWNNEDVQSADLFEQVWRALKAEKDIRRDKESFLLLVEAELKKGQPLSAQRIFVDHQLSEVSRRREYDLMYGLLTPLLKGLCETGNPISINDLLTMMSISSTCVPDEALIPDENGRTFASQWLEKRVREHGEREGSREELPPQIVFTTDGRQARIIDGVKIGFGNCAVNDDGTIMAKSKMKVGELRAECKAHGIQIEGARAVLADAITKARRASPSIAEELNRGRALARKKKALETSKQKKESTAAAKKKAAQKVRYTRFEYVKGQLVSVEEVPVEEAERLLAPLEAPAPEPKEEEGKVVEVLRAGERRKLKKWTDTCSLRSRQYSDLGNNQTAGINAAVTISESIWKVGSFPTLEDFETMAHINEEQRSPIAAWKIGTLLQKMKTTFKPSKSTSDSPEAEYESRVLKVVYDCCRICLSAGFPDACEEIIELMKKEGRSVEPALLQEVKECRAKAQTPPEGAQPLPVTVLDPDALQSEMLDEEKEELAAAIDEDASVSASDDEERLVGFSRGGIETLQVKDDDDADLELSDEGEPSDEL